MKQSVLDRNAWLAGSELRQKRRRGGGGGGEGQDRSSLEMRGWNVAVHEKHKYILKNKNTERMCKHLLLYASKLSAALWYFQPSRPSWWRRAAHRVAAARVNTSDWRYRPWLGHDSTAWQEIFPAPRSGELFRSLIWVLMLTRYLRLLQHMRLWMNEASKQPEVHFKAGGWEENSSDSLTFYLLLYFLKSVYPLCFPLVSRLGLR